MLSTVEFKTGLVKKFVWRCIHQHVRSLINMRFICNDTPKSQ